MANEAEMCRQRAQQQRDEARNATLPNVRARAEHAAQRWDLMADQLERTSAATLKRDAAKAARDEARETDT